MGKERETDRWGQVGLKDNKRESIDTYVILILDNITWNADRTTLVYKNVVWAHKNSSKWRKMRVTKGFTAVNLEGIHASLLYCYFLHRQSRPFFFLGILLSHILYLIVLFLSVSWMCLLLFPSYFGVPCQLVKVIDYWHVCICFCSSPTQ